MIDEISHTLKLKIKRLIIFLFAFVAAIPLHAQNGTGLGKYGASFLQISSSARQVAMGEAFTGIADDINLLRYNVGAIGFIRKTTLGLNYHQWIEDTQQGSISMAMPLGFAVAGVDFIYFNEGEIAELGADFEPTGAFVSSNDIAMSFASGFQKQVFGMRMSFGGAAKVIRQTLATHSATALGMDLGVLVKRGRISIGGTIQNFSITKLKFDGQSSLLPETYRAGIGLNTKIGSQLKVNLGADIAWLVGQRIRIFTGGEVLIGDNFAIRGGYKVHEFEVNRWAVGMGLYMPMKWLGSSRARFDYSFSPIEGIGGNTHRFSLIFEFRSLGPEIGVDQGRINKMTEELQRELEAARRAREETEKAERKAKELAKLMEQRLAQVQQIAKESKGKIEVHTKVPTSDSIWVTMRINFDFDKANIRPDEYETMHRIARILNTYPGSRVHITGHTDFIGTEEYNIRLSHRRIDSVMVFLHEKEGIDLNRFYYPIGYGKQRPIADNHTPEGRFLNRRVEFIIYTTNNAVPIPQGTAIKYVKMLDDSTVQIVCNGIVKFKHQFLTDPDRIVLDFPGIFLLPEQPTVPMGSKIFLRARLGYHEEERFSRIVLDLAQPVRYEVKTKDNIIFVKVK